MTPKDILCYTCKYRGSVPGSSHSCCKHPKVRFETENPLGELLGIFASVGRMDPVMSQKVLELGIRGNPHGIAHGWFNWPWNFDPAWLETCDGYQAKEETEGK